MTTNNQLSNFKHILKVKSNNTCFRQWLTATLAVWFLTNGAVQIQLRVHVSEWEDDSNPISQFAADSEGSWCFSAFEGTISVLVKASSEDSWGGAVMAAGVWGLPGNMFFMIHSVPVWSPKQHRQRGSQICPPVGDTQQKAEITRCQITEGV